MFPATSVTFKTNPTASSVIEFVVAKVAANSVLPVTAFGVTSDIPMVAVGVCPTALERSSSEVNDKVITSSVFAKLVFVALLDTIETGEITGSSLSMKILLVFAVTSRVLPVKSVIVKEYVTTSAVSLPVNCT